MRSNSTGIRDGGSSMYRVEGAVGNTSSSSSKHRNNNKTVQLEAASLQFNSSAGLTVKQFPAADWAKEVDIGTVGAWLICLSKQP